MTLTSNTVSEYNEHTFKNLTEASAILTGKAFYDCVFENCSLREIVWDGCSLIDCSFTSCDLSLNQVANSTFRQCTFKDCQLVGINWVDAQWSRFDHSSPIQFFSCNLNYSTLAGLKLQGITMKDCSVRDVYFAGADLTRADCRGSDFSASRFAQTNLTEADFSNATNYEIDVHNNTIKQAKFTLPEAVSLLQGLDIILDAS